MPTYVLKLDSFTILTKRSRHNQSDTVVVDIKVYKGLKHSNQVVYGPDPIVSQHQNLGDYSDHGTYPIGMSCSVDVPDTNTVMKFAYFLQNGEDQDLSDEMFTKMVQVGVPLAIGGAVGANPWSVAAGVALTVGGIAGSIFDPNCNGPLAGDAIEMTAATLASWAAQSHSETRQYPGVDSPGGCGDNSLYDVTFSVAVGVSHDTSPLSSGNSSEPPSKVDVNNDAWKSGDWYEQQKHKVKQHEVEANHPQDKS